MCVLPPTWAMSPPFLCFSNLTLPPPWWSSAGALASADCAQILALERRWYLGSVYKLAR